MTIDDAIEIIQKNERGRQGVERAAIYRTNRYCISNVSCLRLSCCINALNFCVHYLCLIGWVYMFYVGHVDRIDYMKPFSIL
jgi:hypothetical protein